MKTQPSPAQKDEVVVYVPKGTARSVKIVECEEDDLSQDITVQVSRERKPAVSSAVGVIVK